jgi:hypothetical protein
MEGSAGETYWSSVFSLKGQWRVSTCSFAWKTSASHFPRLGTSHVSARHAAGVLASNLQPPFMRAPALGWKGHAWVEGAGGGRGNAARVGTVGGCGGARGRREGGDGVWGEQRIDQCAHRALARPPVLRFLQQRCEVRVNLRRPPRLHQYGKGDVRGGRERKWGGSSPRSARRACGRPRGASPRQTGCCTDSSGAPRPRAARAAATAREASPACSRRSRPPPVLASSARAAHAAATPALARPVSRLAVRVIHHHANDMRSVSSIIMLMICGPCHPSSC